MAPGTYTYTVAGTAPCPAAAAIVEVTVVANPDAGTPGAITQCTTDAAVDLFAQRGGTSDAGGTWSGPSTLNGSSFDPGTMFAGVYTYTITVPPPCSSACSTVTVTLSTPPDPGVEAPSCSAPPVRPPLSSVAWADRRMRVACERAQPGDRLPPAPSSGGEVTNAGNMRAVIKTKFGDIEIKFLPDVAPKHVDNFIKLAKTGFYNGTIFHRVIPGFMIQGGDPNTKDSLKKGAYGQGGPGQNVKAEFSDLPHKRGVVSMARAQDPDSAGSQFFIVVEDSRFLDRKYTIFGEVVKGIGVADKIVALPRVICQAGAPSPADKGPVWNYSYVLIAIE